MDVDGMPDNPEEILTTGYLKDVEGPLPVSKDASSTAKIKWAKTVYPRINQLEGNGISWDWVNDASIQQATINSNKQINIRGNIYQALILAEDSIIQLAAAKQISKLAANGIKFMAMGTLPHKQPSFLQWQENDIKTIRFIATALKAKNSKYIADENELTNWIKDLHPTVTFNGQYHFTRQVQRDMSDGSRIQFIWNKSDEWQRISLTLDKKYKSSQWLNADAGTVIQNTGPVITYQMVPYGSVILYACTNKIVSNGPVQDESTAINKTKEVIRLNKWDIKADSITLKDTALFDWRTNEQLKFSSAEGFYTSSFQWNNSNPNARYYLDLGKVYFTAEVMINDKPAGKRIFAPYLLDITPCLQQGENKMSVKVTPGQLNGFIGKAKQGDARYKQFKGKEDQLMSAGLVGPVVIRIKE